MICNPYICIEGKRLGEITWSSDTSGAVIAIEDETLWINYAEFERGKLNQLVEKRGQECEMWIPRKSSEAFMFAFILSKPTYCSVDLIGYSEDDFMKDSESNRLLKRAEFLKAVCEKEGVEWLPKEPKEKYKIAVDHIDCLMMESPGMNKEEITEFREKIKQDKIDVNNPCNCLQCKNERSKFPKRSIPDIINGMHSGEIGNLDGLQEIINMQEESKKDFINAIMKTLESLPPRMGLAKYLSEIKSKFL